MGAVNSPRDPQPTPPAPKLARTASSVVAVEASLPRAAGQRTAAGMSSRIASTTLAFALP